MRTITMTDPQLAALQEAILMGALGQRADTLVCMINNNQGSQRGDSFEREQRDLHMAAVAIMNPTT